MKRSNSNLVAPAALLAALCLSSSSFAAEPPAAASPAADEDRAAQLYKQGHDLYDQGKPGEAEKAYQAAWDIRQSFDVAANLGNVELVIGQPRDAAEHLAYALQTFPLSGDPAKKAALQKRFDEARAQVGALKITIVIEGSQVFIDGQPVKGPLPAEIFVEPGEHTCEGKKPGFLGAPQKVKVEKGGSGAVELPMTPAEGAGDSGGKKSVPLIVAGVVIGVGGVAAGIGLLAASGSKGSQADSLLADVKSTGSCPNPTAGSKCDELLSLRQSKDTLHNVALPVMIVGGAALVGTLIYALLPSGKKKAPDSAFRAAPAVSPQGGGLWMTGSF